MVLDQMKKVGGSHFKNIGVQKLTSVGNRWHVERRFEQFNIADAGGAAIARNLVTVNLQHLNQTEEFHGLVCQLFECLGVTGVDLVKGSLEGLATL